MTYPAIVLKGKRGERLLLAYQYAEQRDFIARMIKDNVGSGRLYSDYSRPAIKVIGDPEETTFFTITQREIFQGMEIGEYEENDNTEEMMLDLSDAEEGVEIRPRDPLQCDTCGKLAKSKAGLASHKRIHKPQE